jgi:hypothetical protein
VRDWNQKRAKGVMRIRNFLARFSGVFGVVVRDCCHDRARLGCSRRRAVFRASLPLAASRTNARRSRTRGDPRSRKREFFDNLTPMQPGATPFATWCNLVRGRTSERAEMSRNVRSTRNCAKRTHFCRAFRCSRQHNELRASRRQGTLGADVENVPECSIVSTKVGRKPRGRRRDHPARGWSVEIRREGPIMGYSDARHGG